MAVRAPAVAASGARANAADVNQWSHGWVGYQPVTVAQNIPDSETNVTNLLVTPTLVAGRRYKVSARLRLNPNAAPIDCSALLYADAVLLGASTVRAAVSPQVLHLQLLAVFDAAASGAVTFKVTGQCTTPGQSYAANGNADDKSIILVEDVGTTV